MIRLICPECSSNKITFLKTNYSVTENSEIEIFICEECEKAFTKDESFWESE